MFNEIFSAIKFAIANRKELRLLTKEALEVKQSVKKATADKKITKKEMKEILLDVDDVLTILINMTE